MAQTPIEQTLRDLPAIGTLVKDRGYRQVWRFAHEGKGYFLKFFRRSGGRDQFRRFFRGSPAAREFYRLQWLQKAGVPAPRAVAFLTGFSVGDAKGDAVILEAIEPSVSLDDYLSKCELQGEPKPDHHQLAAQVIDLVHRLGQAGLGHDDLHLGNFLLREGRVYLIDAYAVRRGGLKTKDVLYLGAGVSRFATRADFVRGWRKLTGGDKPPQYNPTADHHYAVSLQRIWGDNRYFGRAAIDDWTGVFFRHTRFPRRWSAVSRLNISDADWEMAWIDLVRQITAGELQVLKRSRSGDVLAGEMRLAGQLIPVIVKRPRRRYWYRYLNEIGRGSRPRRAWRKAWNLIARNLPTGWPIALMETRRLGYVTDAVLVTERVPGPTLWQTNLDALAPAARETLFRRTGSILRRIEQHGFSHFDAKASNWIVLPDAIRGPVPILIDPDGVRRRRWVALGIRRLLRSLRQKKQYTPEDSLALCQGYAPFTRMVREEEVAEQSDDDEAVVHSADARLQPAAEESRVDGHSPNG